MVCRDLRVETGEMMMGEKEVGEEDEDEGKDFCRD